MKTWNQTLVQILAGIILTATCGISEAQTVVSIGTGTTTTFYNPFYLTSASGSFRYSQSISLFTAAEIGMAGKLISLQWNKSDNNGYASTASQINIYVKHTTATTVSTAAGTFATQLNGATLVYSNANLAIPAASGWLPFDFQTAFTYNGSENLMILVDFSYPSAPGAAVNWYYTSSTSKAYCWAAATTPPTSGYGSGYRPNTKLTFASPGLDAGILTITNPPAGILPGTQAIKATLANLGSDTITTANLGWSVNGVSQLPFAWTGVLPPAIKDTGIQVGTYNFPQGVHLLKAWTSGPNGTSDTINHNDTSSVIIRSCIPMTGTYSVGGGGANYQSISAAVADLSLCGVSGPVIINVLPGTYNEQVNIIPVPGASDTNTVTIRSSTGNAADVTITASPGSATSDYVLRLNGADFVSLVNLTIKVQTGAIFGRAVVLNNSASFNKITGNIIQTIISTSSNYAGIFSAGTTTDSNNVISGNTISGGYYGIYSYGISSAALEPGIVIDNNTIIDFTYCGLYMYYLNAPKVRNNMVRNTYTTTAAYGLAPNYCFAPVITGNKVEVRGSGTVAPLSLSYTTGNASDFGLIANNFLSQTGTSSTTIYGIYGNFATYQNIYNNSISVNSTSGSSYAMYINGSATVPGNLRIVNNILRHNGAGYAFYGTSNGVLGMLAMDYNDLHTASAIFAYWSSAACANIAALQTASSLNANSVSIDPEYASEVQLYPSNITLDNKGTFLSAVPGDIDGLLRSTATPDIGAAEFSVPANDAGIVALNGPFSPIGQGMAPVEATFKNLGQANLASVTLNFSVNGSAVVSYAWSGYLSPDSSAGPITIGSFNFPLGVNTVKAWTSNPNGVADSSNSNDTMKFIVNVCSMLNGTYTIGDTLADFSSFGEALAAMADCGVNGNVIFNVLPGTYYEQVTITGIYGASNANRVTFRSSTLNAADVILTYAPTTSTNNWVLRLNGAGYINIMNMTIRVGASASYGYAVVLEGGANYNLFQGNVIQTLISTSQYFYAINSPSTSRDQYNYFLNNTISGGYYNVNWNGSSSNIETGNAFEGNTFSNFYYYGPSFNYQAGLVFSKNTVTNATATNTTLYGPRFTYCTGGFTITKNRILISGTGANYILYMVNCSTAVASRGIIANNFISYSGSGTATYGLYVSNTTNTDIYHNSIHVASGGSGSRAMYMTSTGGMKFKNNTTSNLSGGYAFYGASSNSALVSDYNNLYTTGANLGYWTSNISSLAGWIIATQKDTNSVSLDPLFFSPTLLYPSSFLMDNKGIPVTEVSDDINGLIRSLTTPDIGAAEYTPPTVDAGMSAVNSPASPINPGTYDVSVSFKNFGLSPISSLNLHWKMDTLPVVSQSWLGYLMPDSVYGPLVVGNINLGVGTHTLKAWTSGPNGSPDGNAVNDTLIETITVCNILDTVYTIGDTLADYPDFNAAVNAMVSCGISAPVTFRVKPGTYYGMVSIPEIPGASATNRVTFESETGNAADVVMTWDQQNLNNAMTLRLNGADYLTFRNMTISVGQAANTHGRAIVLRIGSSYNVFEGNIIKTKDTATSGFSGIHSFDGTNEYNQFINNEINGGYYGIYLSGNPTSYDDGNIISGNNLKNFNNYGIYALYQHSPVIRKNTLKGSNSAAACQGLTTNLINGTVDVSGNNISVGGTGIIYGMSLSNMSGSLATNAMVYNNIVTCTGSVTSTVYGINFQQPVYLNLYHNTIQVLGGSPTASYSLYLTGASGNNNRLVNNIIINSAGGMGPYISYSTMVSLVDNNDYVIAGNYFGSWNGSSVPTFAAWKTTTGIDIASHNIVPMFNSPILLVPTAPALDDKGMAVTGVANDYYGNPRDTLTPDIGAAEWDPVSLDIGVLSWDAPNQYFCGLGSADSVKVTIFNNSITSQSGFVMKYSINSGASWSVDTVLTSIPAGDTIQYTFTQPANFSAFTTYNCKAVVIIAGDQYYLNDTINIAFTTLASVGNFPVTENMESFTVGTPGTFANGWIAEPLSGFSWQVKNGATPTSNTGPDFDHTLGTIAGKYVFTEADGGYAGDEASLISPCLSLDTLTIPQVRFWYHMYGNKIDTLSLDVARGGVWTNSLFTLYGQQQASSTAAWQQAVVSLAQYADAEKIRFRVTRGSGIYGDVAVDDITIEETAIAGAAMAGIDSPKGGCDQGMSTVVVRITNEGTFTINSNLTAFYQLGGNAPVSEVVTDSISPGDTLSYTFATQVNLATLKDTIFSFNSYISLAGDAYHLNDTVRMDIPSYLSPPLPLVTNATIPYGSSASLVVQNPDSLSNYHWYDLAAGGTSLAINDTFITPNLYSDKVYYVEASGSGGAKGMTTAFTGNIGQGGNMFDLISTVPVVVDSFYVNTSASGTVQVYYRKGSYVGYEQDPTAWTLLGSANVVSAGMYNASKLFVGGLNMSANQTYGIYITKTSGTLNFNNQSAIQNITDGTLSFKGGTSNMYPFGNLTQLRLWNGRIFYNTGNGCNSDRVPDSVFVNAPVVIANAGNDLTICAGDTAQLNVVVAGGSTPYTYNWSPPISLSNTMLANPLAFPQNTTTYSVTVTDQNGESGTDDVIVTVNPSPLVTLDPFANVCLNWPAFNLTGGVPAGGTFTGTGVSAGVFNPGNAGLGPHLITYSYTDTVNGCTGYATQYVTVNACIGIEENAGLSLVLYPNPADNIINIELGGITEPLQLRLINIQGQIVYLEKLFPGGSIIKRNIKVSTLPAGVYYIRLEGEKTNKVEKVVIE